nr:immunoglobulin heavy chain junction region [Mus musculus]
CARVTAQAHYYFDYW